MEALVTPLANGSTAFPALIDCIRSAQESIYINMFIWRDDAIGNRLAEELLAAANRGVNITFCKDRYGTVCEHCEENRRSFFHKKPSLSEKVKIFALSTLYNPESPKHQPGDSGSQLYSALMEHPCFHPTLENRFDHSKFYVFDQKILMLGGINVEDKELTRDYAGREYRDYMVKIESAALVEEFLRHRADPLGTTAENFLMNIKKPVRSFEVEQRYLQIIAEAQESLTVCMGYLSPLPHFIEAFTAAAQRGVDVRVLIPAAANFQDASNKRTAAALLRKSNGRIRVFLSPHMTHAKFIMTEKIITVGSANITKKAFKQLDELNYLAPHDESAFAQAFEKSAEALFSEAREVLDPAELPYNDFLARIESVLV